MHGLPLTEPVAVFTVVLLVLLAAPLVARRGVPSAVVLLVAGVALGPNALGVLDRDPTMVLLGTVGLLYIMFLAGLEIDLHELGEGKAQSLTFGAATFALPLAVGAAVGAWGFGMGAAAAVLLGSVFASHTLLAYPAAARLGLQKARATTTAVGATILTDTLALLVLAVVASGARERRGLRPSRAGAGRPARSSSSARSCCGGSPGSARGFCGRRPRTRPSSSCSSSRPCSCARSASRPWASSPSSARFWPGSR